MPGLAFPIIPATGAGLLLKGLASPGTDKANVNGNGIVQVRGLPLGRPVPSAKPDHGIWHSHIDSQQKLQLVDPSNQK